MSSPLNTLKFVCHCNPLVVTGSLQKHAHYVNKMVHILSLHIQWCDCMASTEEGPGVEFNMSLFTYVWPELIGNVYET